MSKPTDSDRVPNAVAITLVVIAAMGACAFRLIPFGYRPPNCTPVGALGLFAGGRLRWWQAAVLPLAVMALADWLLWTTRGTPPFQLWVYASMMGYVVLGLIFARTESVTGIGLGCLLGSLQ